MSIERFPCPLKVNIQRCLQVKGDASIRKYAEDISEGDIEKSPYADNDILFSEVVDLYVRQNEGKIKPYRLKFQSRLLRSFVRDSGNPRYREFCSRPGLDKFYNRLILEGKRHGTIDAYRNLLIEVERFAYIYGLIDWSPITGSTHFSLDGSIPPPKKVHLWDKNKVMRLCKACSVYRDVGGEWRLTIMLLWETGMRFGDACRLQKSSLDEASCAIRFSPGKTTRFGVRTNRFVEIPISAPFMKELRQHADKNRDSRFVFPRMEWLYGKPNASKLRQEWRVIKKKCRIYGHGWTLHAFRHSFITRLIDQGVNPALIADMAGVNLERVMTYIRSDMNEKRKALNL